MGEAYLRGRSSRMRRAVGLGRRRSGSALTFDEQLGRDGYGTQMLLSTAEARSLLAATSEFLPAEFSGFFSSLYHLSPGRSRDLASLILEVLETKVGHLMEGFRLTGAVLAAKYPPKAEVPLHRDWTIVDEGLFRSFGVWVPLTADRSDESFCIVPGSHRGEVPVRSVDQPSEEQALHQGEPWIGDQIRPEVVRLVPSSGEGVFFDHALLHGTTGSSDPGVRVAAVLGLVPRTADYVHYIGLDPHSRPLLLDPVRQYEQYAELLGGPAT